MRVTPGMFDRNFLSDVSSLNELLEQASRQLSTGKKLLRLKDSPSGSAELVGLRDELSEIDQFRANSDNVALLVSTAESALSAVHDLVTSIFTKGSFASSESVTRGGRASIAAEIRTLRDQLLSLANTTSRGRYLFAGSKVTAPAFTISGDQVTYHGDQEVNKISIGNGIEVQTGVVGSDVFSPVFAVINTLLNALDSNDVPSISVALEQFQSALGTLGRFRGQLGADLGRLQGIKSEQDTQEENIRSRQSSIEDANLAQVITQLTQIQSALKATLTAQSTTQRYNLFDFLG